MIFSRLDRYLVSPCFSPLFWPVFWHGSSKKSSWARMGQYRARRSSGGFFCGSQERKSFSYFHPFFHKTFDITNAIKFTPAGGKVSTTAQLCRFNRKDDQADNGNPEEAIKISVSDTGIGLKPEDSERIFKQFEQVENSASRKFQGTGLGLSLTKSLVELHGGEICAESEGLDKGAQFSFMIPV